MNKDTLTKGIIIPVVTGVIICIAFFVVLKGGNISLPINSGTVISSLDSNEAPEQSEAVEDLALLADDTAIGTLTMDSTSLMVRYNSSYGNLVDSVSLTNGSKFGDVGVAYLEVLENNVKPLNKEQITIASCFGDYEYKLVDTIDVSNRQAVFAKDISVNRGVVLYCQRTAQTGVSKGYRLLIYKEVQR